MLTLLLGKDWVANRNEILNQISADVLRQQPGRILLVPELISHDTERRLAAAAGDTASRFAQVLSFTRLGRRISDLVGGADQVCLDNGGRVVAMASAAISLNSRMKAYASVQTKPEFLTDLVDAVDEFKRCCISAADLRLAAGEAQGSLAQKLEELSLLMEGYDALCAQGKKDPRDQMTWALEKMQEIGFAQNHVFYIDGFPDFTRQHFAILEYLIAESPQVIISLNCDSLDTEDLAFEKAKNTARELLQCAAKVGQSVNIEYVATRNCPLEPIWGKLYQGPTISMPQLQPHVSLMRTESVYETCQAAAEQILSLVRQGYRYRQISLVCGDLEQYRRTLQLVFRKCGIPLYLSGTEDILGSGVIGTVLHGLQAAVDGLEQADVLRYLRSTLSPLSQEDCDLVENHAIIWGISGKKWTEPWQQHPEGLSGVWDEASQSLLQKINTARSVAIRPLENLRRKLMDATNLGQQILALTDFLEEIHFAERLGAYADSLEQDGFGRDAQILNQLWEILLDALEQLYAVLSNTCWDTEHFGRLLRLLLSQYDVGTIPAVLDAVMAGPVSAMRCQQEKVLLVLGAEEGALPGYGGSAGLLSDQERDQMRRLGMPLTGGGMEGLQAEFAEIYGVFCGAEEKIQLYSCSDQPSFLYRRLERMIAPGQLVKPILGSALTDPQAAGAFLAKCKDRASAVQLGLEKEYFQIDEKRKYHLGTVSTQQVQGLYGKKLRLSASQVDRHGECRLSYFLKYGLRAKERKEATVDPAEFGTYVHAVLEQTVRDVMALGGFHCVDLEQTMAIARRHSDEYSREHFDQLDSQRMTYLFRRNLAELEMVVQELWRELHLAEYVPKAFELQFDDGGDLPAIQIPDGKLPAQLRGFVDRMDTWRHGDTDFFRVVDYKTGKKDFDYCDVFNGVGLQMLLYLFALEDGGEAVVGSTRVGAGVQYFPARAPFVTVDGSMTPQEAAEERKKEWKRRGLLLSNTDSLAAMDPTEQMDTLCCSKKKDGSLSGDLADRQQLGMLKQYVMKLLKTMVDQIADGDIQANPYTRGTSHNACTFCPYGSICREGRDAQRRNYKTMTSQRFWEEIQKEVGEHG